MSDATVGARRVLLIQPPWAYAYFPGLSVSLLRSILLRDGLACDLLYANLLLSREIAGNPLFEEHLARHPIAEMAFVPFYFDVTPTAAAETMQRYLGDLVEDAADNDVATWRRLIDHVDRYLDAFAASVDWRLYDVVGISLMFQQTVSALALARRIKSIRPDIKIVFGGPSCVPPMGQEMLRSFPEIDAVALGEADHIITGLFRALCDDPGDLGVMPGVAYRSVNGTIVDGGKPPPFNRMNDLPTPDYAPYLAQVEALGLDHFEPFLYLEMSRGCWWGEKHHCNFCGIDDLFMTYRSKAPERVREEILLLAETYRRTAFLTADNILDNTYFQSLLPELADVRRAGKSDLTFFFEVKSTLSREKVALMRDAGVTQAQPGIESFSDGILKAMDKGATGIQQIQTLRYMAEFGIEPNWNIIYKNPGDQSEHYRETIAAMDRMHHLPPPPASSLVEMLLQRFSPYFERPDDFGITDIQPQNYYRDLYPRADIDLTALAFFFTYDRSALETPELNAAYAALATALDRWRAAYRPDSLLLYRGPGFIEIVDDRPSSARLGMAGRHVLEGLSATILEHCDRIRTRTSITAAIGDAVDTAAVDRALRRLIERGFLYRSATDQFLALPLRCDRTPRYLGTVAQNMPDVPVVAKVAT